jgi:Heterokaryon incompatibility protein (HET)
VVRLYGDMNHLPTVADPAAAVGAIEIPYHGHEYQSSSFFSYPADQGLTDDYLLTGRAPDAKGHLETWFYFGMLCEVLGPLDQNDFLCADTDGHRILTTVHLEKYANSWWKRLKAYPGQKKKDDLSKAHRCIDFVYERLNYGWISDKVQGLLGPSFVMAVIILGSSLSHVVARFATKRLAWHQKLPSSELQVPWQPTSAFLDDKMLEAGWCPNEVQRFKNMLSPLTQAYALGLRRHCKLRHDSCTRYECKANNADAVTYRTAHVRAGCQCQFLSVDVNAVKRILEKEVPGIPLIEVRKKSNSVIELKVVEYHSRKRYVAVSHVWSDGMGNCHQNALPQCQLAKLWELGGHLLKDPSYMALSSDDRVNPFVLGAAHLWHAAPNILGIDRGTTTIWIDSLCVPLEDKPRKVAIRGMKDVYAKGRISFRTFSWDFQLLSTIWTAHRVMILDSELLSVDHVTKQETMIRIMTCSGWMRRLWTFQEGVFAHQRAYVYFRNKAVRIPYVVDRLVVEHTRGNFPLFGEPIFYDAYGHWLSTFRILQESLSRYKRFENSLLRAKKFDQSYRMSLIWITVMGRTTSKETDRPVIMASLLGLDTAKILAVPVKPFVKDTGEVVPGGPAERMRKLYEMVSYFPQSIIFQEGERFPEQGWRWAVTSCKLSAGTSGTRLYGAPGRILQPYGLSVSFPGLVVLRQDISVMEAPPSSNVIVKPCPILRISDAALTYVYIDLRPVDFTKVYDNSKYGIGLLLSEANTGAQWCEQIFGRGIQQTKELAMVSIYKEEQGALYSRFEGHVTVWRHNYLPGSWIYWNCPKVAFVDDQQGWWVG